MGSMQHRHRHAADTARETGIIFTNARYSARGGRLPMGCRSEEGMAKHRESRQPWFQGSLSVCALSHRHTITEDPASETILDPTGFRTEQEERQRLNNGVQGTPARHLPEELLRPMNGRRENLSD